MAKPIPQRGFYVCLHNKGDRVILDGKPSVYVGSGLPHYYEEDKHEIIFHSGTRKGIKYIRVDGNHSFTWYTLLWNCVYLTPEYVHYPDYAALLAALPEGLLKTEASKSNPELGSPSP